MLLITIQNNHSQKIIYYQKQKQKFSFRLIFSMRNLIFCKKYFNNPLHLIKKIKYRLIIISNMKVQQNQEIDQEDATNRTNNDLEAQPTKQDLSVFQQDSKIKSGFSQHQKRYILAVVGIILLALLVYIGVVAAKIINVKQTMNPQQDKSQIKDKQIGNPSKISEKTSNKQVETLSKIQNNPSNIQQHNAIPQKSILGGEINQAQQKTKNKINTINNIKESQDLSQEPRESSSSIIEKIKNKKIQEIDQQLQKLMNKQYSHDCVRVQTFFHYYNQKQITMYYRTPYPLYFPACMWKFADDEYSVGRLLVQPWVQQRQMIQWARKYVKQGDHILFDCIKCMNYLQLLILGKFVGQRGIISAMDLQQNSCMKTTRQLNHVINIRAIRRTPGIYQNFTTVISFNEQFFAQEIQRGLLQKLPNKILVKLSNKPESIKNLQKISNNNKSFINKIYLNNSDCKATTKLLQVDNKAGYYQIITKQLFVPQNVHFQPSIQIQGQFLKHMEEQYTKFKLKIPSPSQRKDITQIAENFRISPLKLFGVTQKELQEWVTQLEVVEWVKNRTKGNQIIFLQQSKKYNLLTILNTAAQVPQGKIILSVDSQKWPIIKKFASKFGFDNIIIVNNEDSTISGLSSAQILILDNLATIQQFFSKYNISQKKVLGYFDQKISGSNEFLYKLYVNHYIRRVRIKPSFYYGYEIFDNFFFSSENPTGFFEIQKQTYTIYQFWVQSLKQMNQNRRFCVQQIIKANTPEVKVISPTLLPYFILPEEPFHKAFQFLNPVHKSDYCRSYFMHFYGGGYADIKHVHYDYLPYFEKLYNGPQDKYAIGYHEIFDFQVACYPEEQGALCKQMRSNYTKIMGNANYIFKKRTPLSAEWFNRAKAKLDLNYQKFKKNSHTDIRDYKGKRKIVNGKQVISQYPLGWAQIAGAALVRSEWSHFGHYYLDMPYAVRSDYR